MSSSRSPLSTCIVTLLHPRSCWEDWVQHGRGIFKREEDFFTTQSKKRNSFKRGIFYRQLHFPIIPSGLHPASVVHSNRGNQISSNLYAVCHSANRVWREEQQRERGMLQPELPRAGKAAVTLHHVFCEARKGRGSRENRSCVRP